MASPLRPDRGAVKGTSGESDNLLRLLLVLSSLVPGGTIAVLDVENDDGCPCEDGGNSPACTCELVNVTVRAERGAT